MFDAYEPDRDVMISIKEYDDRAACGDFGPENSPRRCRCPACGVSLQPRAGQRRDNRHFWHPPDPNGLCPLKHLHSRPYLNLQPRTPNSHREKELRRFASDNVQALYNAVANQVPYLDLLEFVNLLREARRLNCYAYQGCLERDLPFVLLTLHTFLPTNSRGKKRALKFRFFYDSTIQHLEDLWIHKGQQANLFRASYRGSVLQKITQVDRWTNFPNDTAGESTLSELQLAWLHREV